MISLFFANICIFIMIFWKISIFQTPVYCSQSCCCHFIFETLVPKFSALPLFCEVNSH